MSFKGSVRSSVAILRERLESLTNEIRKSLNNQGTGIHLLLPISDDIISFAADVVGVLLGAFLGYLLGLRQQRKIDEERDERKRIELKDALRTELVYIEKEVTNEPETWSELFNPVRFNIVFLDMPTFTSIVNSGQLLLLDSELVKSLSELNSEVHEHKVAQTIFASVGGSQSPAELGSHLKEFEKIIDDPSQQTNDRLAVLLKVVVAKRKIISHHARELIQKLITDKKNMKLE